MHCEYPGSLIAIASCFTINVDQNITKLLFGFPYSISTIESTRNRKPTYMGFFCLRDSGGSKSESFRLRFFSK